ncbi:MAG TPA: PaaI family thioesterase [Bryobacteraceae bacterium]|nr:PaaI family thioesterase [Bryobacteraceae bacterium]
MPDFFNPSLDGRELEPGAYAGCFACGPDNPKGLHMAFNIPTPGRAEIQWTPSGPYEGYPGILHGGIVSTVLDEAMSKAVTSEVKLVMTAELKVRFRAPVESGVPLTVSGWIVKRGRRLIEAEASIVGPDGVEHAHGWATFLPAKYAPA